MKVLWGGSFWTSGYYANTVGQYAIEDAIRIYIRNQVKNYKSIYESQLNFDFGMN